MKLFSLFFTTFVVLASVLGVAVGQDGTAVPFLVAPVSPETNGMGGITSSFISSHPMASVGNPAQLAFLGKDRFLSAGIYLPASSPPFLSGLPDASFSALALNAGLALHDVISLPLYVGIGYSHITEDLGEFTVTNSSGPEVIGRFQAYEGVHNISVGIGIDSWVRCGVGGSAKFVNSQLSPVGTEQEKGTGQAKVTAYDFGLLLVVPAAEIASRAGASLAIPSARLEPLIDLTLGLAKSNIGDRVVYVSEAQADPFPRQATLGAGLEAGLVSTSVPGGWKLFSMTFVREASDILVRRHYDGTWEYVRGAGDVNFFDNVLGGKPGNTITQRKGWQVELGEFMMVRGGSVAEPYRTYSTTGFGVRLDGLLKALSAIRAGEDQSWIQFLRDNVDLRYDYSTFRYGSWGELQSFGAVSLFLKKFPF